MSSNAGNSLWGRIQSWWKGVSGSPSEATTVSEGQGAPVAQSGQERQDSQASAEAAPSNVQQRVSDINAGLREQAGKMTRPLEDTTTPPPGTTGASSDEFSSGGYAPEPTSPAKVAAAADDAVIPEPAGVAEGEKVGIPPAPGAEDSTYATRVDDVTSGQDAPERADASAPTSATRGAETAEALEDTPAATGQDGDDFLEAGMTGADSEPTKAGQPVGQGVTFDPQTATSDAPPVYDEGTADSDTIRPAGSAALEGEPPAGGGNASTGGTYAATAGDIATAGPSTSDDLGIDSSADLDASELGSLEDSEDIEAAEVAAAAATTQPARFGARQGADLSRTGLYADIRGEDDTASFDEPATTPPAGVAGPTGTPIEQTVAGRVTSEATEGAGNLETTAGDDYSAARSAEMTAGSSPESTTTSAIGEEMASGEEADDLVGEPPRETPAPGVAVDMGAETTPERGDGYAGAVRGDGTADTPPGYPIKGKASSMVYHTPDMPSYQDTKPDWCFATEDDAKAAGFRPPRPRNLAGNSGPAASAPAGSAGDTGSGIVDPHAIGGNPKPADVAPASKMTDSINRYSDPQVSGGGRLTEEVMDADPAGTDDQFGSGADDIESLSMPSPDDTAASEDVSTEGSSDDSRTT